MTSMATWEAYKANVAVLWEHGAELLTAFDTCDWARLAEAEGRMHREVMEVICLAKGLGIQPPEGESE